MDISALRQQFDSELAGAASEDALRTLRDKYLARKGGVVSNALKVGSSRVDLQACKLEYSIVSPK